MINFRIISYVFWIILFIYILNFFIYYTVGFSYFDFYLYYNKISNLNIDVIFFGHFQPIIYLYKIIDILVGFHGLIILKTFFLILPFIFFYKQNSLSHALFYLLFPYIFVNSFINFNLETLAIILLILFIYYYEKKEYYLSSLSILACIFIKEIYVINLIIASLLFFKDRKFIIFSILLTISIIFIYFFLNYVYINSAQSSDVIQISNIFDRYSLTNDFAYKLLFLSPFIVLFFLIDKIYYKYLFICSPNLIFILITKNDAYYSPLSHYSFSLIPFFIYAFLNSKKGIIKLKNINLLLCLLNIFIFIYFINSNDFKRQYQNNDSFLKENIPDNSSVTIQNRFSNVNLFKRKYIFSFPNNIQGSDIYEDKYFDEKIISKYVVLDLGKTFFLFDKKVNKKMFYDSSYYKNLIDNYYLINQSGSINVYKKK